MGGSTNLGGGLLCIRSVLLSSVATLVVPGLTHIGVCIGYGTCLRMLSFALGFCRLHISLQPLLVSKSVGDSTAFGCEVGGSTLSSHAEAKQLRFVEVHLRGQHDCFGVLLEENMGEGRAKEGPIKSIGARRDVHLFALGAIDLDSILTKLVAEAIRHHALLVTKGARTMSIRTLQVLSVH